MNDTQRGHLDIIHKWASRLEGNKMEIRPALRRALARNILTAVEAIKEAET